MKKALIIATSLLVIIIALSCCSKPEDNDSQKEYGNFVNSDEAFKVPDTPDAVVSWPSEWNSSNN